MERIAVNSIIQGSNADIIKVVMIELKDKLKKFNSKILLQIHDELLFEVIEKEKEIVTNIIKDSMENIVKIDVPLKVNIAIGQNWGDLK